ncbi:MAG: 23S rRNA (guanosine(2251)-2'-O)-methyltransferase RlmB [Acidimicrobiia bacterium]|nr:MAG: 23S rRNA (guanosine(2251)-2'-O)-methyltransferase RlmB [Acidimicrobiia bacterium]
MALAGIGTELEGIHAVEAALIHGRVTALSVEQRRMDAPDLARIVRLARSQGIPVNVVDDVRPLATTGAPQGVFARARPISPFTVKEAVALSESPALLVLDHVEDPRNIGAAARSAVAAGITALVVSQRRSAPIGATAFKAAAGALEDLPLVVVSSIAGALKRLDQLDVWKVGLDGDGDTSLLGLDLLERPVAVCIGSEGEGLSKLVAERCDVLAYIPMVGGTESLNASVAAALASYEVARVRGWVS